MTTFTDEMLVRTLPKLRVFALTMVRNREKADDLVQETIVRAMSHKHMFEANPDNVQNSVNGWLYRIMRNLFITEVRTLQRQHASAAVSLNDGAPLAVDDLTRLSVPPLQIKHMEAMDTIRLLKQLPKHIRETLLMAGLEELNQEEIALRFGVSLGTVKSRISRARKMLREQQEAINGRVEDNR